MIDFKGIPCVVGVFMVGQTPVTFSIILCYVNGCPLSIKVPSYCCAGSRMYIAIFIYVGLVTYILYSC